MVYLCKTTQRCVKRSGQAMDPRVREDDNVFWNEILFWFGIVLSQIHNVQSRPSRPT
jgi:hypothetical protein